MLRSFCTGALGYPALELLYRRRTHYSMALAGGLSVMLMHALAARSGKLITKALIAGMGVTAIEYGCGRLWNKNFRIWDYRKMPLNYKGQICLPYTALWCVMSAGVIALMQVTERKS